MSVGFEKHDGTLVAVVEGRMDGNTSPAVGSALTERIEAGDPKLVLDLQAVTYISSAFVRILIISARKCAEKGGRLVICGLNEYPREVLRVAGLLSTFTVRENRVEAVAAL